MKSMKFIPQISGNTRKSKIKKPIIILVRPEQGGNIGATMRAMANFGLEELRLVLPGDNWLNFDCVRFAMGAMEHLKTLRICRSLYEALHDIQMSYALTVRTRKDMDKENLTPAKAMEQAKRFTDKWAFVLGNEVSGLDNHSVALCNEIITIQSCDEFSSLNLSQAAVICCYAWHAVAGNAVMRNVMLKSMPPRADMQKVHYLLCRIYENLKDNELLTRTPNSLEITMQHLQNLIMRTQPTDKEISLIYRITGIGAPKFKDLSGNLKLSQDRRDDSGSVPSGSKTTTKSATKSATKTVKKNKTNK